MKFEISVADLLNTKYLQNITRVVGGKRGLNKIVRWVHILEVRDVVKECVDGNEMVLTTGIGFITKETAQRFLKELIEQGVSALCIETSLYYHVIDQELINLADQYDFPLIEITTISRFMDITKGLNTLIINNESNLYLDADHYDNQLNLNQGTILDGIKYTAEYLDLDVCYFPVKGKPLGSVLDSPDLEKQYADWKAFLDTKETFQNGDTFSKGNIAIKRIQVLGKIWGYLIFTTNKRTITQFETIILNRLSNKLRLDFYSELMRQEEKRNEKNEWIRKWLDGSLSETVIKSNIKSFCSSKSFNEFLVCCTDLIVIEEYENPEMKSLTQTSANNLLLHGSAIVRRVFEDQELTTIAFMDRFLCWIILIPSEKKNEWQPIESAVKELINYKDEYIDFTNALLSVGKRVKHVLQLHKSYETAMEYRNNNIGKIKGQTIFDKMYLKQILEKIESEMYLYDFIQDHLGELLDAGNAELLQTLKTYYQCNCSKQKTADKLFVARQTLYFRLHKIEEIFGSDFEEHDKRNAIAFAIQAYSYLNSKNPG